jgi:hypothetical protein
MSDDVEEKPAGWCCRWSSAGCYGVGVPVVVAAGVERCRECHEEWQAASVGLQESPLGQKPAQREDQNAGALGPDLLTVHVGM